MKLQTFLKPKKCGEAPVRESLRHIFISKVLSGQEVKNSHHRELRRMRLPLVPLQWLKPLLLEDKLLESKGIKPPSHQLDEF